MPPTNRQWIGSGRRPSIGTLPSPKERSLDLAIVERRRVLALFLSNGNLAMCGCSTHQTDANQTVDRDPAALTLRVEDMTCGHCAGTIKKAIETGVPGTSVEADPTSRLVSVRGSTDLTAIKALVTEAGYTPTVA
jgi:copper chaperone